MPKPKYDREACVELFHKVRLMREYERQTGKRAEWPTLEVINKRVNK